MYYILGLNHYIQYVNKKIEIAVFTEFVQYISSLVQLNDIDLIAEEFNEDCLELNHVQRSVLQLISEENAVRHLFMDPIQAMRTSLGIPSAQFDEALKLAYKMREDYWLNQLQQQGEENILICIGASHVQSFANLLNEKKQNFMIVDPYWNQASFQKDSH